MWVILCVLVYWIFYLHVCVDLEKNHTLILEKNQYNTKVFEFISNEHTRKNVMLIGQKSTKKADKASLTEKINDLKKEYGIDSHYLETLV